MSNLKLANLIEDFKIEVIAPSGDSNISELKINIDFVDFYKSGKGLDNIKIEFTDESNGYYESLILNENNLIEGNIFDGKLEGTYKYKLNPGTYEVKNISLKTNSISQVSNDYIELSETNLAKKFVIPIFPEFEEDPPSEFNDNFEIKDLEVILSQNEINLD